MSDLKNECSVLIPSCDAYSDLWAPFFYQFNKHWSDCPFQIYLGSNYLEFDKYNIKTLKSENENIWSNCMLLFLSQIKTDYVLISLEDFFLRKKICTEDIMQNLNILKNSSGHVIRLVPRNKPDIRLNKFKNIGEYSQNASFRVSTQASIWKKDSLLKLIKSGESIWEFEVNGSIRSTIFLNGFYGVYKPIFTYGHHVVERGKWFRKEAAYFGRLDIGCDFKKRPIMSIKENMIWNSRKILSKIFHILPRKQYEQLKLIRNTIIKNFK